MRDVRCDYCQGPTELVGGDRIYPHRPDLSHKRFYLCPPCDAYVGCHPNTTNPLGRLANAELRAAKQAAHAAFDRLWKSGRMSRTAAYAWLTKALDIPANKCHIGMFDIATCRRTVEVCKR